MAGPELLKVIAIFFIILSHEHPGFGDSNYSGYYPITGVTTSIQQLLMVFNIYLGQVGNCIFIVCSSWFLIDSDKVRFKKILRIELDVWLINIILLVGELILSVDLSVSDIISSVFPTLFTKNWFLTCYMLYCLICPLLNRALKELSKEKYRALVVGILIFYSFLQMIIPGTLYFNNLIGFLCIHTIVGYVKLHMKSYTKNIKINTIMAVLSFCCLFILVLVTNGVRLLIPAIENKLMVTRWSSFMNPLIICFAISALNLLLNVHLDSRPKMKSAICNISALSMLIYLFHENLLTDDLIKPVIFSWIHDTFGYDCIYLWCILVSLFTFVSSIAVSWLYRKITAKIADRAVSRFYGVITSVVK